MPCNCDHMKYGYNPDDYLYGPQLYLHPKREEIRVAGGVFLAIAKGLIGGDDVAARKAAEGDVPMRIACYLADHGRPADDDHSELAIEARVWLALHERFDAERRAKESEVEAKRALKEKALAKLTDEERRVLGLAKGAIQ